MIRWSAAIDAHGGVLAGAGRRHGLGRQQDRSAAVEVDDGRLARRRRRPSRRSPGGPPRRRRPTARVTPVMRTGGPYSGSLLPPISRSTRRADGRRRLDRRGVPDRRQERRHAVADQGLEHDRRIAGRARPDVVADVEQHDRPRVLGRERLGDRLVGRRRLVRRTAPASPRRGGRDVSRRAGRGPRLRRRWRRRPSPCAGRRRTGKPSPMLADSIPGSTSSSRAAARNVFIGSSTVPWTRMLSASGGFSIAWTGEISPRTVRAISSAQRSPRSRQSTWGLVCQASVTVAGASWAGEMLPWVSTTTPIGTRGPTAARTRRIISASASGIVLGDRRPVLGHQHAIERPFARRAPRGCGSPPSRRRRG